MKKILLNENTVIDLDKLIESRLLIQANSGGGKSWAIRRLIEQSFGKVQIIVLDPEGEFGNMRSEFDFVYAGKGGDAPVESRSAALLARRLLELKASAIIDLYELAPQDRKHFVRLFCEAMVNAPKELWHDCLVIIDEAHVFAPEKSDSEALGPVIDLATRGRKRGYCVVLASQRISKLHKDAAAECNNKLIGRTALDIDRKRAGEELGLTSREEILSLRNLMPGEFMAFGPAIGIDVKKLHIGDVSVKPPTRGVTRSVAAPSATVKKILSKLADLPQEAVQEARTVHELKAEISLLKRQNQQKIVENDPKEVEKAVFKAEQAMLKKYNEQGSHMTAELGKLIKVFKQIHKIIEPYLADDGMPLYSATTHPKILENMERMSYKPTVPEKKMVERIREGFKPIQERIEREENKLMGEGERKVLIAIAQQGTGMSRDHVTVQTGYKRSTRDAYIQRLVQKEYIGGIGGNIYIATDEGREALGNDYEPLPTGSDLLSYHLNKLPKGESTVLDYISFRSPVSREDITEKTGFKRSTRDAYIQRLATRQLVVIEGQTIRISEHLL